MTKILVAEDDAFLANAYRVKLLREGYEVQVVSDGAQALKNISVFKPDLLILDLMMPVMDGFTTLEEIKKSGYKKIPILVATNLEQSEDIVRATKLGAEDYIVKSELTMGKLAEKVKSLLQASNS